ncbi:cytochrome C oxidase subunit II [Paenibacillus hemerocallicola]|jgi:cytochrome c oxidase subunit 2|uniref:Cytochrome C oxidase subunit II n=1 Tax=Paenibacillus hemerocallicola TaxID=1172614 RepID=A0A5C4T9X6_9BACL|nr:cupredoxin domain-containing protein [Paenibacillus hemerocallicola]TNJ65536.1 cytochrome C oxidase subunit II [Paenibacillus hemerocallicola]
MKKTLVYLLALIVVLVLAACAKKEESSGAGAPAAGPATGELKITATNWKFDKTEYKVKKGETLTVKLDSTEGAHGIKIDKIGDIGTNKTKDITFDKAGTYDITCSIPCGSGHATMKAKLIVE